MSVSTLSVPYTPIDNELTMRGKVVDLEVTNDRDDFTLAYGLAKETAQRGNMLDRIEIQMIVMVANEEVGHL